MTQDKPDARRKADKRDNVDRYTISKGDACCGALAAIQDIMHCTILPHLSIHSIQG